MRCATGLFALSVLAASFASPVPAAADHDISIFYEELSPYGDWVHSDRYGWVWTPYDVPSGWRPYTHGSWEYTDHGWTWVSDEHWGWATYHYGRWYRDPYYGWAWVPGTEWGPAWVAWREGEGYVGWAPLPPEAEWRADFGLSIGDFDLNVSLGSDAWTFVDEHRIIEPHIHRHVILPTRNVTILHRAPVVTHYRYVDGRVVNYGVPVERVERVVGRRVYRTPVRVVDATPRLYRSGTTVRYSDGGLNIYRPTITRRTTTVDPRVYRTRDVDGVRLERRRYSDDRQGVEVRRRSIEGQSGNVRRERDYDDDEARRDRQMRERQEAEGRSDVERRREAQERRGEERGRREAQERRRDDEKRKVKKSKPNEEND